MRRWVWVALPLLWMAASAGPVHAPSGGEGTGVSLKEVFGVEWPGWRAFGEVVMLKKHNTRVVVLSTCWLGVSAGLVGSFLLLRKRSLMSDTLSHACLPGIGLAFLLATAAGMEGKSLPLLLLGATVSGTLGVGWVMAIRNTSRIKDDAAMGIVLSVFFGLGVVMLSLAQQVGGSAAGLESFIYGKTASIVDQDYAILKWVAVSVMGVALLLQKEFTLICFDEAFARSQGWPVHALDLMLLLLVTGVTVAGLQAVGLILIIAYMIIPAASARFWTHRSRVMLVLAAVIGGISGWLGASVSALIPGLPAGALIVLVSGTVFLFSMVFGSARGVLKQSLAHRRLRRKVGRQHLLRAVYELREEGRASRRDPVVNGPVAVEALLAKRSWTRTKLMRLIRRARREDLTEKVTPERLQLSESGFGEAARHTRNHRLWELYLIRFADVAPRHVDRDADRVEHVLGSDLVRKLEEELDEVRRERPLPESPHALGDPERGGA